jgi:hypothetical protein
MSKNVIVVGMPRSGTSLTASIFTGKGYHIGDMRKAFVREGNDHNPFGSFEADDLIAENVRVLDAAGFGFHNTWLFEPISSEAMARIADMSVLSSHRDFVRGYEQRAPWVWKDPRLCFTLAYWWRLMDPERTAVIFVRRDPTAIYWSFLRRGWCRPGRAEREAVLARIQQHTDAATAAIESLNIPHVVVDYGEYVRAPGAVAHRLSVLCDLSISVEDLNARADLDHSSVRGRISTGVRRGLTRLPRRSIRRLERLIPRWALVSLFPERRYVEPKPPAGGPDDRQG